MHVEVALAALRRREDRVADAWASASGEEAPRHVLAWQHLGWLGPGCLDAFEFEAVVQNDVAQQGPPASWSAFIEHYNRCLTGRRQLFTELYCLGAALGEGGFGTVVQATRHGSDTPYALKQVAKDKLSLKSAFSIEEEMRLWARAASCTGCVRYFGSYELADQLVLVTELCEGGCLLDLLVEVEHFTELHAKYISWQVCKAVVFLHRLGVAHRDIKSENVLCTDKEPHQRGHVKLCDFGCAAEFDTARADHRSFRQFIGTPEYLAPEMVEAVLLLRKRQPAQGYTYKVDYWALGCLIYELFAGEPPFFSEDDDEQFELTLSAPLTFPEPSFGKVEHEAQALIVALLERDPALRAGEQILEHPWLAMPARRSVAAALERRSRASRASRASWASSSSTAEPGSPGKSSSPRPSGLGADPAGQGEPGGGTLAASAAVEDQRAADPATPGHLLNEPSVQGPIDSQRVECRAVPRVARRHTGAALLGPSPVSLDRADGEGGGGAADHLAARREMLELLNWPEEPDEVVLNWPDPADPATELYSPLEHRRVKAERSRAVRKNRKQRSRREGLFSPRTSEDLPKTSETP